MLKKFLDGLIFGAGFGIAFVAVWIVSMSYIFPTVMESKLKEPKFDAPKTAQIAPPQEKVETTTREYSFFKRSGGGMQIPDGGGILAMAKLSTEAGTKRQRTFQLWLTKTTLWKIRTNGDGPEVEKLPYPEKNPVDYLDDYIHENIGLMAGQSKMTVSRY